MGRKSKYKGVFKTNEHGYEYWIAQHTFQKRTRWKRCESEILAAKTYDEMRKEHGLKPVNESLICR